MYDCSYSNWHSFFLIRKCLLHKNVTHRSRTYVSALVLKNVSLKNHTVLGIVRVSHSEVEWLSFPESELYLHKMPIICFQVGELRTGERTDGGESIEIMVNSFCIP